MGSVLLTDADTTKKQSIWK